MSPSPLDITPDDLLRHGGFLRRLARSLVHDEHAAEDLVQQAWVSALEKPPRAGAAPGTVRAFLSRIVRNRAISLRREEARRRGREEHIARGEALPPAADVLGELDLQELVLALVKELDEPYRTTVFLRYYRDLGPKQIARELGVPVATVDTRLLRARARLRDALDRRFRGSRGAWMAILLPWANAVGGTWPVLSPLAEGARSLGASLVGMKLKIGLLSLLSLGIMVVVGVVLAEALAPPAVRDTTARLPADLAAPGDASPAVRAPATAEGRSEVRTLIARDPDTTAADPATVAGTEVRCQVIDPAGDPIAAVPVLFRPEPGSGPEASVRRGTTDADGICVFSDVRWDGNLVTDPEWELVTVLHGMVRIGQALRDPVVVAVRAVRLEVRVIDDAGLPIAGARVQMSPAREFRGQLPQVLDSSLEVNLTGETGPGGVFVARRTPAIADLLLSVRRAGYRLHFEQLADRPEAGGELVVVLTDLSAVDGALAGRVLDERGAGANDVTVTLGMQETRSDADGWFFFDAEADEHDADAAAPEILAFRRGWLPATCTARRDPASGAPLWPDPLVLQLTAPSLTITGRILDGDGRPLAGYRAFSKRVTLVVGGVALEAHLGGDMSEVSHFAVSDGEGRFALSGLLDRDYELAAISPSRLLTGEFVSAPAGAQDVVLRVDASRVWSRVRGRVVDQTGGGVEGVSITLWATTQIGAGAGSYWSTGEMRDPVRTDDAGRFLLEDVPRDRIQMHVTHADITPRYDITLPPVGYAGDEAAADLDAVTIVVSLRLRFQVVLDDPEEADELRVLDEAGEELQVSTQKGLSNYVGKSVRMLSDGRSQHLFVDASGRTLVLLREGIEVRRAPLVLEPRRANIVRF